MDPYIAALIGGLTIGLSTSVLLLFKGRVFGISGIVGGIIKPMTGDVLWRIAILAGLISGGLLVYLFYPEAFPSNSGTSTWRLIVAGLLVGFGTQLGGGCTSGHGVCGISRLSVRSIVATVTFIASGVLTVLILNHGGIL